MAVSTFYFAYGSNMHVARLRARASSAEPVKAACLADHAMRFDKRSRDGSGKCNIRMQPGGRVYGVVYRIAIEQRHLLDRAEGPGYVRRPQVVNALTGGRPYRVFLYMAKATWVEDALRPYDWYRELVVTGAEQHGLPLHYVKYLRTIAVYRDRNRHRSRSSFNIIQSAASLEMRRYQAFQKVVDNFFTRIRRYRDRLHDL